MKKCTVCMFGTWTVGLVALAVGITGVVGGFPEMTSWLRVLLIVAGLVSLGFMFYQPPLAPCPRCVRANDSHSV